eukprot:1140528-Heterocapsa_arctica.AAC.1
MAPRPRLEPKATERERSSGGGIWEASGRRWDGSVEPEEDASQMRKSRASTPWTEREARPGRSQTGSQ